jgi:uncharacterized alkaline shock family protein YloU
MTPTPEPEPSAGLDALTRATDELRAQPLPRVVEIADSVLRAVRLAPRRSMPVRARPPHDFLRVSTVALTAVLRENIDSSLVGAAMNRVDLDVGRDDQLRAVAVEFIVRFGVDILELADRARVIVDATLTELLGPATAASPPVEVTVTHVHVTDVTVGDPHLVDPADEKPFRTLE